MNQYQCDLHSTAVALMLHAKLARVQITAVAELIDSALLRISGQYKSLNVD